METTDRGGTWTDLTEPTSSAALQADVAGVGISPDATADGDRTTPVLVATSPAPNANFYPTVHYGTIDSSGAITGPASALFYDDGATTVVAAVTPAMIILPPFIGAVVYRAPGGHAGQ